MERTTAGPVTCRLDAVAADELRGQYAGGVEIDAPLTSSDAAKTPSGLCNVDQLAAELSADLP